MSDLLHNAALFVALLWAPRHFYWSTHADDRVAWTSEKVKETFSTKLREIYVLLADNTELVTESSLNLILQSFLFSSKLVWRAPLSGGVTKEITGMEQFVRSLEYQQLRFADVATYMFTDRGFKGLPLALQEQLQLLTPGLLDEHHTYPKGHSAWKQAALGNEFFPHNFYYIPPPTGCCMDSKRLRLDNWLSNLRERKALDKALEDRTIELHLKNLQLQRELNEKAKLKHDKHLVELASEQKSMFVSTLSHEIRTPLHGIMTAATLLNSMNLDEEAQEYTNLVQTSSMHLQSVLNDVLSMSLLETGKVTVETEQFNLRDAVQATMKMVSLGDAAIGKRFDTSILDLPAENVLGDRKKLTQVLLNLMVNASKFTGDDGVIKVGARVIQPHPDGLIEFTVADNGIGIAKERLADVCRPFFQVEQGNTRRYSGLGLGLSVCKSLIEVLKGELSIHSEGVPGKGTVCTFTFPFRARTESCLTAPSLHHHLPISAATEVLLVEDNRLNAAITTRLLNKLGISRVTTVADGLSAVQCTREGNFDLVLMDLHMPGHLDGFEAARLIKVIMKSRLHRAKVVALTANVSDEVRRRCETEMDGYIAKPLSVARLVEALRNVDLRPSSSAPSLLTSVTAS